MPVVRPWILLACTLLLFAVWSNSFIAVGYLLGSDTGLPRLDYRALTAGRFLLAAFATGLYCGLFQRQECMRILRASWPRLLACSVLAGPGYNLALNYGQQHGVAAPIASLTTTLVPLFVMVLASVFLDETIGARKWSGFAVATVGMAVVSTGKLDRGSVYPLAVAITAIAPLCWSIYSVLSKPLTGRFSPVAWTYMAITGGGLMMLPLLPGPTWNQWTALDLPGWVALLYLSLPCTVMGFALWTWLLRHLPASSVGLTVFLNPPFTAVSKLFLASWLPATFAFTVRPTEWLGGALTLAGLAIAVLSRRGVK